MKVGEHPSGEYLFFLNNFKPITSSEPIQIRIGNITLLIGKRGVGKSSIIEALHLLEPIIHLYKEKGERLLNKELIHELFDIEQDYSLKSYINLKYFLTNKDIIESVTYPLKINLEQTYFHDLINKFYEEGNTNGKLDNKPILGLCMESRCFGITLRLNGGEFPDILVLSEDELSELVGESDVSIMDPHEYPVIYTLTIDRLQPFIPKILRRLGQAYPAELGYLNVKEDLVSLLNYIKIKGVGPHGYLIESVLSSLADRKTSRYEKILSDIYNKFIDKYNKVLEYEGAPYRLLSVDFSRWRNTATLTYYSNNSPNKEYSIPISQLSRGSLNLIAFTLHIILADYFSKSYKRKYIIALEEPEATLHSSAMLALLKLIMELKRENEYLGFIITSHSYRLLALLQMMLEEKQDKNTYENAIIYVLKQSNMNETMVFEYLMNTETILAPSLDTLNIEELNIIHKIVSRGVDYDE